VKRNDKDNTKISLGLNVKIIRNATTYRPTGRCLPDSPKPVSPKPDSPKLGFRVRVRVGVSANRVSAKRDWTYRPYRYLKIRFSSRSITSRPCYIMWMTNNIWPKTQAVASFYLQMSLVTLILVSNAVNFARCRV